MVDGDEMILYLNTSWYQVTWVLLPMNQVEVIL